MPGDSPRSYTTHTSPIHTHTHLFIIMLPWWMIPTTFRIGIGPILYGLYNVNNTIQKWKMSCISYLTNTKLEMKNVMFDSLTNTKFGMEISIANQVRKWNLINNGKCHV